MVRRMASELNLSDDRKTSIKVILQKEKPAIQSSTSRHTSVRQRPEAYTCSSARKCFRAQIRVGDVDQEADPMSIPLNYDERTGHLPHLLQDVIGRLRLDPKK